MYIMSQYRINHGIDAKTIDHGGLKDYLIHDKDGIEALVFFQDLLIQYWPESLHELWTIWITLHHPVLMHEPLHIRFWATIWTMWRIESHMNCMSHSGGNHGIYVKTIDHNGLQKNLQHGLKMVSNLKYA